MAKSRLSEFLHVRASCLHIPTNDPPFSLEVKEDTTKIVLNTHEIKIHSATLSSASLKTETKYVVDAHMGCI